MKPGNLVKITRASVGIPKDTLALVIKRESSYTGHLSPAGDWIMYSVKPVGLDRNSLRRYYARDLALVSQ